MVGLTLTWEETRNLLTLLEHNKMACEVMLSGWGISDPIRKREDLIKRLEMMDPIIKKLNNLEISINIEGTLYRKEKI